MPGTPLIERLFALIDRRLLWFGFLLALILYTPVLSVSYFPSEDSPVHLDIARLMRDLGTDRLPIATSYLQRNPHIEPNSTIYYLFMLLGLIFTPAAIEKVFLFFYALIFAAAGLYCVDGVKPVNRQAWLMFLPLTFSAWLQTGNYNYCLGLAFFLFALGYYVRAQGRWTVLRSVCLGLLGLLCTLTHVTALVMLVLTIALLESAAFISAAIGSPRAIARAFWQFARRGVHLLAILAPSLAIFAAFSLEHGVGLVSGYRAARPGLAGLILMMRHRLIPLLLSVFGDPWFYAPFFLLFAALAAILIARTRWRDLFETPDRWLAALAVLTVFYFLVTVGAGSNQQEFYERMPAFLYFIAILWFAGRPAGRFMTRAIVVVVALTVVTSAVYRELYYSKIGAVTDEILTATSHIKPNSTILSLDFDRRTPLLLPKIGGDNPMTHIAARVAALTDGIAMDDSQLSFFSVGAFPIQYRPDKDPYRFLAVDPALPMIEATPPDIDLAGYAARTGGAVDYLLALGLEDSDWKDDPVAQAVFRQIAAGYREIYRSEPTGAVTVYERLQHAEGIQR